MVNLGPSNGCQTCKKRRIKCDEGKPHCQRCILGRRKCGGYQKKPKSIRFKDEVGKRSPKASSGARAVTALATPSWTPIPALRPVEGDVAVSFFLNNFAGIGRDFESARGFFEALAPAVTKELPSSALSVAVTAVAIRLHRLWRGADVSSTSSLLPQTLGSAISRLQQALQDEAESKSSSTVLATLVLQFYEYLSAAWGRRRPSTTHNGGAVALLMHQHHSESNTAYSAHIIASVLHNEVSSAIREQRPVLPHIHSWITRGTLPLNPSATLDLMGLSIASVHHRFLCTMDQGTDGLTYQQSLDSLWAEVKVVDDSVLRWTQTLPKEWLPIRLQQVKNADPPILTYGSNGCDIYPSIQIASIWNTWRCYRLLLLQMAMVLLDAKPLFASPTGTSNCRCPCDQFRMEMCIQGIREVVDSMCDSVAFHLGNCQRRSTLHDLTDLHLEHPSYHDLPAHSELFLDSLEKDIFIPLNDHRRHAVVLGPWHILTPLLHVSKMLSGKHREVFEKSLRPGQHEWIQQQIARVYTILDLESSFDLEMI